MSTSSHESVVLPGPSSNQTYVTVSALDGGQLTLPEHLFVTDADPSKRNTVPSMSFLIQHPGTSENKPLNILFDLGLKRDLTSYTPSQHAHILQRQPIIVHPDVRDSLAKGNLAPNDISTVILSHVHWDHVGTPSDFSKAEFIVGSGTLDILANGDGPYYPADLFNTDELPLNRTKELPPTNSNNPSRAAPPARQTPHTWRTIGPFTSVIDFLNDGTIYIIDAPGHMSAHLNLLARLGPKKWVYLGGDCCHDVRILTGEREIAMYEDGRGGERSVHVDLERARGTVEGVRKLFKGGRVVQKGDEGEVEVEVEVVVAHDGGWRGGDGGRFWPGRI